MTLKQHLSLLRTREGRDLFRLAIAKIKGTELEELIVDKFSTPDKPRQKAFEDFWENTDLEKIKKGLLVVFEAQNSPTL